MSVSISESPHASPERRVLWIAKMLALVMAMTLAVASFSVCYWAISGELKANTVALASLVMLPALGIVPYLTLLLRSPYVAVLFASFLLGALKLAGCLLSRAVYGPNALADGYMAMSWDRPNLLVWFCLVVGLLCSGVFAFMGYRVFSCHTKGSVA